MVKMNYLIMSSNNSPIAGCVVRVGANVTIVTR